VLSGISKKFRSKGIDVPTDILDELAVLVEVGLPNLLAVKIYQAGIRSRSASTELCRFFTKKAFEWNRATIRRSLIADLENLKSHASENTKLWLELFAHFAKRPTQKVIPPVDIVFDGEDPVKTTVFIPKVVSGKSYLISENLHEFIDVSKSGIDFSRITEIEGFYYIFDEELEGWKPICRNPFIEFDSPE
jgi:hypothetical protein